MLGTVVVFGATSKEGLELCRILKARGETVLAVVRPASDLSRIAPVGVEIQTADVMNPEQVSRVFAGLGRGAAVVSFLGGRKAVDSIGNVNVIDAAERAGAARFVLVTCIGCGDSRKTRSFLSRLFGGGLARAKTKAEKRLQGSSLKWTIVRPGNRKIRKPTQQAILVENATATGAINHEDLAVLVFRVLNNSESAGHIYSAIDLKSARTMDDSELVEVAL